MFKKHTFLVFILCLVGITGFTQKGKDGAKTVSGTEIVNEYTYLTASASIGATTITVQNSSLNGSSRFSGSLQPGDLVMVYNVMGVEINGSSDPAEPAAALPIDNTWGEIIDYRDVGLYEFKEVKSVPSSSQIEFTCPLVYNHGISAFNEKVMVIRVPRYSSLTVPSGTTLTCDPWNGSVGGMVVVEVDGLTTINGTIQVSGLGFRGGDANISQSSLDYSFRYTGSTPYYGGVKGEGIAGFGNELNIFGGAHGRGAPANGGGAGNSHNGGGAGGGNASNASVSWTGKGVPSLANASWATAWNIEQAGLAGSRSAGGGRGGYCWSSYNGNALTQPPGDVVWGGHNRQNYGGSGGRNLDYSGDRIFFGGGGGGGHQNDDEGGYGGDAAGIVFIQSYGAVSGSGNIYANGEEGQGSDRFSGPFGGHANTDGSGGGGAGGTVLIKALGAVSALNISVQGGAGGNQVIRVGLFGGTVYTAQGPGGGGNGGYVGVSSLGPTINYAGGVNGTTNSSGLTEFPPNGATIGDSGLIQQIAPNYEIIAQDDTICGGGSVTITPTINGILPTSGGLLDWYDSYFSTTVLHTGNSFTTPVLSTTTTFYFGGCDIPFRDSVTIYVSPAINIDTNSMILNHESCVGNDGSITGISVSGGSGTLNYYWNTIRRTSVDTFNLSGGMFDLVVIDSLGCSDTIEDITINGTSVPVIDNSAISIIEDTCSRLTGEINGLIVTGGSGNYTYYHNGSVAVSLNLNGLAAGSHELVVSDNTSGCRDTLVVNVPAILPPTVFLGNDTTLCVGQTLLLDATTVGATYSWQDASTNPTFTVNSNGQYWVHVFLNGCEARDTINVTYSAGTPINLGDDTTLCSGANLLLDATTASSTYTWQDASTSATFNVTSSGQYHVEVNQSGCIQRDTINVSYQSVSVDLGNDTSLCDAAILNLDASQPGATYSWQDASTNATFSVVTNGVYWVDVTIAGCTERDSIVVDYYNTPNVFLGNDTSLCDGGTLLLDATSVAGTYVWQDFSGNPTYNVTAAGTYFVEADNFGCIGRDTIIVTYQNISFDLGNDTSLCDNETLTLDATTAGATYLWQDASTLPTYTVTSSGLYWAEVTAGKCSKRDSINILYSTSPLVDLGNDTLICEETELFLDVTQFDATYAWDNGTTVPTRMIDDIGQYYVRVTNSCGVVSDTINVSTKDCSCNILLPNSFTPNNDGFNEEFQPVITCDFDEYELWIYNRWGQLMFYSIDPSESWDGVYNGKLHESSVYVWRMRYRIVDEVDIQSKTGHVSLIR